MKYKATEKFKTLSRSNDHQGLTRDQFDRFFFGKTIDCKPPKRLVDEGYLKKVVKAKESNHGS